MSYPRELRIHAGHPAEGCSVGDVWESWNGWYVKTTHEYYVGPFRTESEASRDDNLHRKFPRSNK